MDSESRRAVIEDLKAWLRQGWMSDHRDSLCLSHYRDQGGEDLSLKNEYDMFSTLDGFIDERENPGRSDQEVAEPDIIVWLRR
jgi:hypothetical protein